MEHQIVSREKWLAARVELLKEENGIESQSLQNKEKECL